jgi:predicted Zn-dependent protease
MSRDARRRAEAVYAALRAASEASGGEAEAEALLRVSRGVVARRARGAPSEASSWREETIAVRALLPGGGEGIAAAATWDDAAEAAARAVALAKLDDDPSAGDDPSAAAGPRLRVTRATVASRPDAVAREPQDEAELLASIAAIERAALLEDERVVALDAALARSAVVESYLATSSGTALHQRHATAAAHAAVIARDGMNVAVRGDAWAGSRWTEAEAEALGRRLGRAGLVHLVGSGAAPPQPPAALLSASALTEITLPFMGVLLGMSSTGPAGCEGLPPSLRLSEDAIDDEVARVMPVDGEGRPLRRIAIVEAGAWRPPGTAALPRVRPGSGDAARPGFLRATWSWLDGLPESELLPALGTGLWIESAHGIASDPSTMSWRGAVAGFWVEDGRRRHAVAGVPFSVNVLDLLRGAVAGGAEPEIAHASGSMRAVPLVVRLHAGQERAAP